MHLTSGIIDEHSHIAISRGVNEGSQASSAEVSIANVINSDDINIYRQLSGGVTTAQLLHGSANPSVDSLVSSNSVGVVALTK